MNLRRILSILPIFTLFLGGCNNVNDVLPTSLIADAEETQLIINTERDLNDIITLRFEPKNTTNKQVTWSSEENDIFTLEGSIIKAKKIGMAIVTATSVANDKLSTNINIKVYDPNVITHRVSVNENSNYFISGLQSEYAVGSEVIFTVNINDSNKEIDEVKANDEVLESNDDKKYQFIMPDNDVIIDVTLKDLKKATNVIFEQNNIELFVGEDANIVAKVEPSDTTDKASWSVVEGQEFINMTDKGNTASVHAVKKGNAKIKVLYNDNVSAECNITINEKSIVSTALAKYDIKYDLGTRKTAKLIDSNEELLKAFVLSGDNQIINSISQMEYIYGGGNGGRGETAWFTGDMLKFGTTSVNGSLTFDLNVEVNQIKITGYVSDKNCKVQVGDSSSTDWTSEITDNKTTLATCTEMTEITKDIVESKQTSTMVIDFAKTKSLKIATTNKKPLYITSIEFVALTSSN